MLVRGQVFKRSRKSNSLARPRIEVAGANKGKVTANGTMDPAAIDADENADGR
jgi:hypothetical protein